MIIEKSPKEFSKKLVSKMHIRNIFLLPIFCLVVNAFAQSSAHEQGKDFAKSQGYTMAPVPINDQRYLDDCKRLVMSNPNGTSEAILRCQAAIRVANPEVAYETSKLEQLRDANTLPTHAQNKVSNCYSDPFQEGYLAKQYECEAIRVLNGSNPSLTVRGDNPAQRVRDAHPDLLKQGHTGAEVPIGNVDKNAANSYKGDYSQCADERVEVSPPRYSKYSCSEERPKAHSDCVYTRSAASECSQEQPASICTLVKDHGCIQWTAPEITPARCLAYHNTYLCVTSMQWQEDDYCPKLRTEEQCRRITERTEHCNNGESIKGVCHKRNVDFECLEEPAETQMFKNCGTRSFVTADGLSYPAQSPNGVRSLMQVATSMEAAREAGVYTRDKVTFFAGEPGECSRNFLKNCCRKAGGNKGTTNRSVLGQVLVAGAGYIGGKTFDMASKYVYDFMFESGVFTDFAFNRLNDLAVNAALQSNVHMVGSFYGLTVWSGSATQVAGFGSQFGFNNMVSQSFSVGGFNFGFDPYSLMVSLAIQVVVDMLTCSPNEVLLAKRYETGLCIKFNERCKRRFLGLCLTWRTPHCCYNSKLAKSIQEQVRPKFPGGLESIIDKCPGFSADEFEKIDFSSLDLRSMLEAWKDEANGGVPLRNLSSPGNKALMQGNADSLYQTGNFRPEPVR